jgi:F-type H+-transporting ATPase subunit alpha
MAFTLYAVNEGYLNDVPIKKIVAYEAAMLAEMKSSHADLIAQIDESGDYNDGIAAEMKSALDNFKANGVY